MDAAAERYEGLRPEDTRPQRRADGLLRMAETVLSAGIHPSPNAERYQVVVHVDAESLNRRHITTEGQCALESGPWLPAVSTGVKLPKSAEVKVPTLALPQPAL